MPRARPLLHQASATSPATTTTTAMRMIQTMRQAPYPKGSGSTVTRNSSAQGGRLRHMPGRSPLRLGHVTIRRVPLHRLGATAAPPGQCDQPGDDGSDGNENDPDHQLASLPHGSELKSTGSDTLRVSPTSQAGYRRRLRRAPRAAARLTPTIPAQAIAMP